MLSILFLPLLLAPPDSPSAAELAAEGEAFFEAAETAARPLDVLLSAHTSFDSAYLGGHDPSHLCRALDVTGLALKLPTLTDDQERKFWEETQRDDLDRLRQDAEETKRDNCRFAGARPAAPRLALIDPDGPPAVRRTEATSHAGEESTGSAMPPRWQANPGQVELRRQRAHTAAGAVLTTAGLGLFGVLAGVLTLERQRIDEMRGLVDTAKAEGRLFTVEEDRRFGALKGDVFRGANAAIGVGAAGLVTLGTGVALLATRKKSRPRAYAVQPYGGPQGAGAVLRLNF